MPPHVPDPPECRSPAAEYPGNWRRFEAINNPPSAAPVPTVRYRNTEPADRARQDPQQALQARSSQSRRNHCHHMSHENLVHRQTRRIDVFRIGRPESTAPPHENDPDHPPGQVALGLIKLH